MESLLPTSRRHDLVFYASGKIDISARVAHILHLEPGDVIDILTDNGEWYLTVKLRTGHYTGRHEGTVYLPSKKHGTFRTWSRRIARRALEASGANIRLRCPCGETIIHNNRTLVTIIYRCSL